MSPSHPQGGADFLSHQLAAVQPGVIGFTAEVGHVSFPTGQLPGRMFPKVSRFRLDESFPSLEDLPHPDVKAPSPNRKSRTPA